MRRRLSTRVEGLRAVRGLNGDSLARADGPLASPSDEISGAAQSSSVLRPSESVIGELPAAVLPTRERISRRSQMKAKALPGGSAPQAWSRSLITERGSAMNPGIRW